jgi:acyl-CoA thioesterase-1
LPRTLATHKPDIVIVELGGSDGLRGLLLATSRENLRKIIELSRDAKARVVLVGMVIPPNYGPRYGQQFRDMFAELAKT